jgi:predicted flap endonuclease-1-like 5' DNA nuclease
MENTTTKKRSTFLSTPLNSVTSLNQVPGVGPVTLERLTQRGITSPAQLIGQFMLLNRDRAAMAEWLHKACAVRQREGEMVAEALFEKSERMVVL